LTLWIEGADVEDRREKIIEAGLALLREEGLSGLTQPRVAARTGLRQSHLTYYYPTRAALLAAVAAAAVEIQGAAAQAMVAQITSAQKAADVMAAVTARRENTRVLVALNQAADREPEVRALFNELTNGFVAELTTLLTKLEMEPTTANADFLHALFVGLSVVQLATSRPNGQARSRAALNVAFDLLTSQSLQKTKPRRRRNGDKA
jgi:DNA-binding transcriptional regulator YbjK